MHILRTAATVFAMTLLLAFPAQADPKPHRCEDTQVRCWIRKYWGGDDQAALRVARCESGYDPHARTGDHYGIFQLSRSYHEARANGMGYTWNDMWDPGKNTRVAYSLWLDDGWSPWVCRP